MSPSAPRNNFDLIRLFAATQVMVWHGIRYFELRPDLPSGAVQLLNFFPGVPIFFFISGFLISASFQRSPSLGHYALNRALRIFPALWVCFFVSIAAAALGGYFNTVPVGLADALLFAGGQLSFVQFHHPDFMRGYGTGVLNGSLWTIPIELQFYLLMPVLSALILFKRWVYLGLLAGALTLNVVHAHYLTPVHSDALPVKLLDVSFLPWIAMFMLGHLAARHWDRLHRWFEGRFAWWLGAYLILIAGAFWVQRATGFHITANRMLVFLVLFGLVLAAAHTRKSCSSRWLGSTDISYGIYIFHMPVYNLWLHLELQKTPLTMVFCMVVTIGLAILSWKLIERPALRLKHSTGFVR